MSAEISPGHGMEVAHRDRERWQRVSALFDEAMDLPVEEREALLDDARLDEALRREVADLLRTAESGWRRLDEPLLLQSALELLDDAAPGEQQDGVEEAPGTRLGPYRILRSLGHGGMGTVYLAERAEGGFEQRVALKVVRPDVANEELRRRFVQERQILAGLQHVNIARLLDGGVTADGRPYFALEYIDGITITEHCERQQLSIPDRLRLFADVCEATAAAHARRIVHRDLKPSNVLVTPDGQVRLLDFGIAKLLAEDETTATGGLTRTGLRLLTPEYAAPEQVGNGAVTPATDVYSLGLLLLELVAGWRPTSQGPRPRLRGALGTIGDTALREEPERRYPSAAALGADVRALLADQPIAARRESLPAGAARLWRRRRTSIVAALAGAAIVALIAGAGWWVLPSGASAPPATAMGTDDREAYELYLRGTFLRDRRRADDVRKSIALFERAIARDPRYARARAGLARAYSSLAEYAGVAAEEAYPRARRTAARALELDERAIDAHIALATVYEEYDRDWLAAERELRRAVAIDPASLAARRMLAAHLAATGRLNEAIAEARRARDQDPVSPTLNHELGLCLYVARDYRAAIAQLEKAIELQPDLVVSRELIVQSHLLLGQDRRALEVAREIVRLDPERVDMTALVHAHAGRRAEAHAILAELAERARTRYVSPSSVALVRAGLGEKDAAFASLDEAYAKRDWLMMWVAVEPLLDGLHSDPRFARLLERIGLPRSAGADGGRRGITR